MEYTPFLSDCDIDYFSWLSFLKSIPRPESTFLQNHIDDIRFLATTGESLWDNQNLTLRKSVQQCILNLPHHTQHTESGVQEISLASKNRKSQYDATSLAIIHSFDNVPIDMKLMNDYETKVKKGNQYKGKGVDDTDQEIRHDRSIKKVERIKQGIHVGVRKRSLRTAERANLLIQRGLQTIPSIGLLQNIWKN